MKGEWSGKGLRSRRGRGQFLKRPRPEKIRREYQKEQEAERSAGGVALVIIEAAVEKGRKGELGMKTAGKAETGPKERPKSGHPQSHAHPARRSQSSLGERTDEEDQSSWNTQRIANQINGPHRRHGGGLSGPEKGDNLIHEWAGWPIFEGVALHTLSVLT